MTYEPFSSEHAQNLDTTTRNGVRSETGWLAAQSERLYLKPMADILPYLGSSEFPLWTKLRQIRILSTVPLG